MTKIYEAGERIHTPQELRDQFGRAELGIDGNAAFALLGPDLQEGEAEFVEIPDHLLNNQDQEVQIGATLTYPKLALKKLRERLNMPDLSYFFGKSHRYGN